MSSFETAAAVTRAEGGGFTAEVSPRWTIAGKPNGGYLLAILGRACVAVSPHPHVIAASAHYLRSPDPGPVAVEVETLRAGRTASQLRASLRQDGARCVEALVTTSTLQPEAEAHWSAGLPVVDVAAPEACVRLPELSPSGFAVPIMGEVDLRIDPATLGFASARPSGRGELYGWLDVHPDDPADTSALLFAVDAFPPATFDIELSGWVPTLELTAYVRSLPVPGPLLVLQRAQAIAAQRVDEQCTVWDSSGRLVAQATQLAGIRLG